MTLEDLGNLGDIDDLSPEERTHFYLLMASTFYVLNQGFRAYRLGTQSMDTWKWQSRALQFHAAQPGARRWWSHQGRGLFDPESDFWVLVDSEMGKPGEDTAWARCVDDAWTRRPRSSSSRARGATTCAASAGSRVGPPHTPRRRTRSRAHRRPTSSACCRPSVR